MKKVYVCGVIAILCIVATVLLRGPMDNMEIDYTEVSAKVVSSETHAKSVRVLNLRTQTKSQEVVVKYNGEEYDLKGASVSDSRSYYKGAVITAYLFDGKLYASVQSARNSTLIARADFIVRLGSFFLPIMTLSLWMLVLKEKQNT